MKPLFIAAPSSFLNERGWLTGIVLLLNLGCLRTREQLELARKDQWPPPQSAQAVEDLNAQSSGRYSDRMLQAVRSDLFALQNQVEELNQRWQSQQGEEVHQAKQLAVQLQQLKEEVSRLNQVTEELEDWQNWMVSLKPGLVFDRALALYQKKEWKLALRAFEAYLHQSQGVHVEEALYFKADCWYHLKNYQEAILTYTSFLERFRKSKKTPSVLLQLSFCLNELGQSSEALGFYQELVQKYPKTLEAKQARLKLKEKTHRVQR